MSAAHYIQDFTNTSAEMSVKAKLLSEGTILLTGPVFPEMTDEVTEDLLYINSTYDIPEVKIFLHTPGGSVTAGLAILDLIRLSKKPVSVICAGTAYSMGAIILAGAEKGRRFILPHSKVMIHEPSLADAGGNASAIEQTAQSILAIRDQLRDILCEATGRSKEEIEAVMSKDTFFTAEEAVEFGLCDEIIKKGDRLWTE